MRKRVLLWAMLCLFLSVTTGVYAVEDVQTTLSLPKTYQQKGGDSYPMSLAITLPTDYKQNLKTFSLSFLVDKSVRVDDFKLDGPLSDNDYRLSASKSDGPKQEIITLVIPDAKNVRGRELNLILNGKFKKGVKNINEVKMSYAYSVVDTKGKAKSIQRDVVSEKGQPKPSGLFTVDTIEPMDNTLTGKAPAKTRVRVFNGRTLIGSGVAKSNGTFAIVVNPQAEGSELSFEFALGKQNETVKVKVKSAEKIRTGSNPNRKKMQDYLDMVKSVPLKTEPT
ncbi:Ig-like domain-containing protein [Aedoeadaptatus coxii]|uniref:Ig-like domain-containing protein n=1 Tax=Aedoeadaptatus coxii TaxID=755172 RepID=UPI002AD58276|nr:Ig-like domain-containing protein [Peptoniphilus coxii]